MIMNKIPVKNKRVNNQDAKKKFRSTKKWKDFRDKIRHEQKIDPITGQKLTRMANLHHMLLDESKYEDLSNEDNFVFLNQLSHKCIHFLANKKDWRKRLLNMIALVKKMAKINGWN